MTSRRNGIVYVTEDAKVLEDQHQRVGQEASAGLALRLPAILLQEVVGQLRPQHLAEAVGGSLGVEHFSHDPRHVLSFAALAASNVTAHGLGIAQHPAAHELQAVAFSKPRPSPPG